LTLQKKPLPSVILVRGLIPMTTPTLMKDGRTISGLFLPVQFLMSSVSLSFSFITQAVRFEIIAFGYVVFVSPPLVSSGNARSGWSWYSTKQLSLRMR